jgi:Lrp/AsnC family transcriptional regulator for asnA, asnC and gidA
MSDLDKTDRQLVEILQDDARRTNLEIGEMLGVSGVTVKRRIDSLIDREVIRVVAVANPFKIGYGLIVIIGLRVDRSRLQQVEKHVSELGQVRFLGVTMGHYDLMLEAWFRTNEDMVRFMTDTLASVPGIDSADSFQVIRLSKYTYDWGKGE